MLPAFLITFREILEASLIVATIVGILKKLGFSSSIRVVWLASGTAVLCSVILLSAGSLAGLEIHELFEKNEALFEGIVMIISALFITWAVFFLHKTFAHQKLALLQKVRSTLQTNEKKGIFLLVFTAVFREGLEIVLFLSTIFFSSQPLSIGTGVLLGTFAACLIAYLLFTATIRLPVYQTFRVTSVLLIFFAAGLLSQGFHELTEAGVIKDFFSFPTFTLFFLPKESSQAGSIIRGLFGISRSMASIELLLWSAYAFIMWNIVLRKKNYS
jgi:high-affinity iron transporter